MPSGSMVTAVRKAVFLFGACVHLADADMLFRDAQLLQHMHIEPDVVGQSAAVFLHLQIWRYIKRQGADLFDDIASDLK